MSNEGSIYLLMVQIKKETTAYLYNNNTKMYDRGCLLVSLFFIGFFVFWLIGKIN